MNKITIKLSALVIAVLICQSGCVTGNRSEVVAVRPTETPTPMFETSVTPQNSDIDIKTSETEAQALLDAGINFDDTTNADGETTDGGLYTAHGYKTSDGVEISTHRGLYKREKNAKEDCGDTLKETDKILKKERIIDGERVLATQKNGCFVFVIRSGKACNIYSSASLKHLLAFEKWRDE